MLRQRFWLKLQNIDCDETDFESLFAQHSPYVIYSAEGASPLEGFLKTSNVEYWLDKKVVGLFDFDQTGVKSFSSINNSMYWSAGPEGSKYDGVYKKRTDHPCFYTMLLPIPERLDNLADLSYPSFVEVENLLPESFLISNYFTKTEITTGNTQYQKVKDGKKSGIWKKVFLLNKQQLSDFEQLYKKLFQLFNISN